MRQVSVEEAQVQFLGLIEAVLNGEEIILMIAQSLVEGLPILSRDSIFDDYNVKRLW